MHEFSLSKLLAILSRITIGIARTIVIQYEGFKVWVYRTVGLLYSVK